MTTEDQTIQNIREVGYGKIVGGINPELVSDLKVRIESLFDKTRQQASGAVPFLNIGHNMIYNLQNKDVRLCKVMLSLPSIRTVLMEFLNDKWYRQIPADQPNYILRSLLGRSGGKEAMPLHIDSFIPGQGSLTWSLQVAIILEDQSLKNGCTLVVPGSHLRDCYADQASLVDAKPLESKAGDIVFWDSRLWHAAAANSTDQSRWSVIGTFGRWWVKQNYDIPRALPNEIFKQLTDSEKAIMGFCSIPPLDETERIDIKTGYDSLRNVRLR